MEARLLARAGFRVTVVTSGVQYMTGEDIRPGPGWCTEEWRDGIRILRTWGPGRHRRSMKRRIWNYLTYSLLAGLASLCRVSRIDRVFAGTDPIFLMPVVFLVSCLKGAGLVLDERDLYPETAIALGVMREGLLYRLLFRMQQSFRKKAIGILAATPGIREKLRQYGFGEKVGLLYNADVFLDYGPGISTPAASLKQQTRKKFLVGYAGGLGKANDIWTLLRADNHLGDLFDLGIIIIGDGENLAVYKEYCQKHKLENVYFLGSRPRSIARKLLKEMDICIQSLPHHPHFSNTLTSKIFDYQGLGKATIFCGRGDTVRLLEASGGGLTVPPGDDAALAEAIRGLLANAKLRQKMGAAGRRWFQQHIGAEAACSIMKKVLGADEDSRG
jgi:glycosyltransferase involved in cell wall biosynthesis